MFLIVFDFCSSVSPNFRGAIARNQLEVTEQKCYKPRFVNRDFRESQAARC